MECRWILVGWWGMLGFLVEEVEVEVRVVDVFGLDRGLGEGLCCLFNLL